MEIGTVKAVFLERDIDSSIEQIIRKTQQQLPFDVILLSANGTYVKTHYFMMVMFSEYIRKFFNETTPFQFGMTVPMKQFSDAVLRIVVQFIYDGSVILRHDIQDEFIEALNFLEFEGTFNISNECDDGDSNSSSSEDENKVTLINATNEVIEFPSSDDEQINEMEAAFLLSDCSFDWDSMFSTP